MNVIWIIISVYMIGYAVMYKLQDNRDYQKSMKEYTSPYNPVFIQGAAALLSWAGVILLGTAMITDHIKMWIIKRKVNKVYNHIINGDYPEEMKQYIREVKKQLNKK